MDTTFTERLERAADTIAVGRPDLESMRQAVARRRRQKAAGIGLASAAVVVATLGAAIQIGDGTETAPNPAPAPPAPTAIAPPGTQFLGIGHVVIAVPQEWPFNRERCGTPQEDTVILDPGPTDLCIAQRPPGVDSVRVAEGLAVASFAPHSRYTIDGVEVERQNTTCVAEATGARICSGTVYLPSEDISFVVESSETSDDVDSMLDTIRVLKDQVAVPGFRSVNDSAQRGAADRYLTKLDQLGLASRFEPGESADLPPGFILGTSPRPGTMLTLGSPVTVKVVSAR